MRMTRVLRGCRGAWLALAGLVSGPLPAQDRAASPVQVSVTREGRLLQVHATLSAAAPATTCYEVLADFEHLEEFVPGLRSSDVLSAPGEPIVLRQVGEAKVAFFRATLDVTLAVRVEPPERIEFERLAGNLNQMRGSWTVAGHDGDCAVTYEAGIEPAFWVPPLVGPRLMRSRARAQLEGLLHEIEARAAVGDDAP
jgi:ribosome-associated toxin RatA of RatAB toxin-antitoxin module